MILVYLGRWSYGRFKDYNNIFYKIKNDLTTGTWQDDIWCTIIIILFCTSDTIAHLIPQTPFATTIGDSLLKDAGGFSTTLGFWWHICFPDEVVQRTLQFKTNNNDGMLVLINFLEFVTVIINYCATLHVVWTSPVTDGPHPVILNITNNSIRSSTMSLTTLILCQIILKCMI